MANENGVRYAEIVDHGYRYAPDAPSNIVFFPAYPASASVVKRVLGLSAVEALLLVAHASMITAFVLLSMYAFERRPGTDEAASRTVLVAFALWPTTFFFRMAYTESLFFAVMLLAMLGIRRNWPTVALALIVGFATATRFVGVALLVPFAMHLWEQSATVRLFFVRGAYLFPLACWGLIAFLGYQYAVFSDPFLFAENQQDWGVAPPASTLKHVVELAILKPVWSVYVPTSSGYWARHDSLHDAPWFSLLFANPLYFLATIALLAIGARQRWLCRKEFWLAVSLLAIPYITVGAGAGMRSQGRYAALAFPIYLVMGELLNRAPRPARYLYFSLCGLFLAIYAALFAAWHTMA